MKALGSCCGPGFLPTAVSAGEREERHQLLDKFPVLKSPFRTDTVGLRAIQGRNKGLEWSGTLQSVPVFLHLLSKSYFSFPNQGWHDQLEFLSFSINSERVSAWPASWKVGSLEPARPGFRSQHCHLRVVYPSAKHFASRKLSSLVYKQTASYHVE